MYLYEGYTLSDTQYKREVLAGRVTDVPAAGKIELNQTTPPFNEKHVLDDGEFDKRLTPQQKKNLAERRR